MASAVLQCVQKHDRNVFRSMTATAQTCLSQAMQGMAWFIFCFKLSLFQTFESLSSASGNHWRPCISIRSLVIMRRGRRCRSSSKAARMLLSPWLSRSLHNQGNMQKADQPMYPDPQTSLSSSNCSSSSSRSSSRRGASERMRTQ